MLPKDIGNATARGLDKYRRSGDPDNAGAGHGSAGNRSLMRCLPPGLFQRDLESVTTESIRISRITHNGFRCTTVCAVYNHMVAALIEGASLDYPARTGKAGATRLDKRRDGEVYCAVQRGTEVRVEDMAESGPPPDMKGNCSGYVLESLTVAVAAVLDSRCLEDELVDVIRIGRDTDTNGAIEGGLLGARDGEAAVPERWKEKLQFGGEFRKITLQLVPR
jgi:ADP-ribosylglycohydrolase